MSKFSLYERMVNGSRRYWAIRRVLSNSYEVRWGTAASQRLPHHKETEGSMDSIIRSKINKGYTFVGDIDVNDESGVFTHMSAISPRFVAEKNNPVISWEFQPPYEVKEDKLLPDIREWLEETLVPNLEDANISFTFNRNPLSLTLGNWSLSFGKSCDFDVFSRRCSGLITKNDGYLPVFLLMAVKCQIEDEQWRNGLFISYDDLTGVGDEIEEKLLEFYGVNSIDDVRDEAVAFGLMRKRINLSVVVGDNADWF